MSNVAAGRPSGECLTGMGDDKAWMAGCKAECRRSGASADFRSPRLGDKRHQELAPKIGSRPVSKESSGSVYSQRSGSSSALARASSKRVPSSSMIRVESAPTLLGANRNAPSGARKESQNSANPFTNRFWPGCHPGGDPSYKGNKACLMGL